MEPLEYLICGLITFGFSFSFAQTPGPFAIFERVRDYVEKRFGEDSWEHDGISCPICLSFYIAMPVTLLVGGGVLMWLSAFGFVTVVMVLAPD